MEHKIAFSLILAIYCLNFMDYLSEKNGWPSVCCLFASHRLWYFKMLVLMEKRVLLSRKCLSILETFVVQCYNPSSIWSPPGMDRVRGVNVDE